VYLYFDPSLQHASVFEQPALAATTERHHVALTPPLLGPVSDTSAALSRPGVEGVVFELATGLPSPRHLELIDQTLRAGRRAWVFWPEEQAVECVDAERLDSLRQHVRRVSWLKRICVPIDDLVTIWNRGPTGLRWIYRGEFPVRRSDILIKLTTLTLRAQPLLLSDVAGAAMYLRTDYWNAGPDDQHMSRVVASLATMSGRIVCLTPRFDSHLEQTRAQHLVMDPPRQHEGEDAIVLAPTHYWPIVKAACQTLKPSYLYDRGTAAQSVGAELSQLLGIPYIVEYRGARAVVREALGGATPFYPELYAQAEELALRQATAIVVETTNIKDELVKRGIDASRVIVAACPNEIGSLLEASAEEHRRRASRAASIETGDAYKDQVQNQWNQNPVGSQHARTSQPHTLDWFLEVERHRYDVYAPWMRTTMEFEDHVGQDVLEIGGGIGTDLAQFAAHGARVTDIDLAAGHLQLAQENFRLRGLAGRFIHHDAESLPFDAASFDLVYSNGVLHHTPNTAAVVAEIHRVLRPGGRAIVMLYAEHSLHYWRKLVWLFGIKGRMLERMSMGEIMSRTVERSANEARPLVKAYTKRRAEALFRNFAPIEILQKQLVAEELPDGLKWTLAFSEPRLGWNLIIKATKSGRADVRD
jgi:ubiquinone/menaquinone biosynthesis C-methylase UbiE